MGDFEGHLTLRLRNVSLDQQSSGVRVSISRQVEAVDHFVEISQTETIYGETNACFRHRCSFPFKFGRLGGIQFLVYAVRDESGVFSGCLGKVVTNVGSLLCNNGTQSFSLGNDVFLDVTFNVLDHTATGLLLQLSAAYLHNPTGAGSIAPYFAVLLHTGSRPLLLHKSEVLRGEKNPCWREFVIPLQIVQMYPTSPIYIYCYNYVPNTSADAQIGYIATSLAQMLKGVGPSNTYMIMDTGGNRIHEKTCMTIRKVENCPLLDLPKLCFHGDRLALCVAIDMTASNGNPVQEYSLHYIHPHSISAYEKILQETVPQFLPYMAHPRIGFGAKVGPSFSLSQCFNLNGAIEPFVNGLEGLQTAYRSARFSVQPYAPTEFSEVIYHASKFAKAETRARTGLYFVLLLLTDGSLSNSRRTVDAIVDASSHPLSIIAIGIGDNKDFSGVKALESPFLKHSDGRLLVRQTFLFSEAAALKSDDVLQVLPTQIAQWHCLKL